MSSNLKRFSVLALSLALSGCGGMPSIRPLEANSPALRMDGFTLTPPQGAGWQISSSDAAVGFFRLIGPAEGDVPKGGVPQTFVITVETQRAARSDIATVDGLIRYTGRFSSTVAPERRQRLLAHKTAAYSDRATDCVRFEAVVEEQPRTAIMEIRGAGFVCRHPMSPDHVVRAMYSERHAVDGKPQSAEPEIREAEAVLKSVEFTALR